MSDICIEKVGLTAKTTRIDAPASIAGKGADLDANADGFVCSSEMPKESAAEFESWVSTTQIDILLEINGKKILKSQLDGLQRFASDNNVRVEDILARSEVGNGYAYELNLYTCIRTAGYMPCEDDPWAKQIHDISALANLKNLRSLNLTATRVSDLGPLSGLKNLTSIDLNQTEVRDIGPLASLKNLTSIDLTGTEVRDIGPLSSLKNLTSLDLSATEVRDISPLANLKNLTSLDLSWAQKLPAAKALPILKKLHNLQSLQVESTKFSKTQIKELRRGAPDLWIEYPDRRLY
jgi:hypothetical protein